MTKKERHNIWKREWRKRNPEKDKAIAKRSNAKFSKSEKGKLLRKKYRAQRRQLIVDFFGGKCIRCGFADIRALQMDHINGRNGEKRLGNVDQRCFYIKKYPKEAKQKYQLLCANCNSIKREENKEYFNPKNN